jgi:hypothetical protein
MHPNVHPFLLVFVYPQWPSRFLAHAGPNLATPTSAPHPSTPIRFVTARMDLLFRNHPKNAEDETWTTVAQFYNPYQETAMSGLEQRQT